jgi:hypothetical protein
MKYLNCYQGLSQLIKLICDMTSVTEVIMENQQAPLSDQRLQLLYKELRDAEQEFFEKIAELEKLLDLVDE